MSADYRLLVSRCTTPSAQNQFALQNALGCEHSRAGESLFDHLEAEDSIEQFLEGFPSVKREQVIALLEESRAHVLAAH